MKGSYFAWLVVSSNCDSLSNDVIADLLIMIVMNWVMLCCSNMHWQKFSNENRLWGDKQYFTKTETNYWFWHHNDALSNAEFSKTVLITGVKNWECYINLNKYILILLSWLLEIGMIHNKNQPINFSHTRVDYET